MLSTLDPELGALVRTELSEHGVAVLTNTTVDAVQKAEDGLTVHGTRDGEAMTAAADVVLVVVGVRPSTDLLARAGATLGAGRARFAGSVGTQVVKVVDLVAARTGLNDHEAIAAGFAPATTTTVADDHKGYYPGAQPLTIRVTGDTHDGLLLGAQLVGRLGTETAKRVDIYATALHAGLTVEQLSDLDLSYTPPLGSPWDAVQVAGQGWARTHTGAVAPA